jgi:putative ABC transport system ATP-binding protein
MNGVQKNNVIDKASAVNSPILEVKNLSKTYHNAGRDLTVLREINLTLYPGDSCAIVGPSGSGKTTLLGLCAGLDDATTGSVIIHGKNLNDLDHDGRATLRNHWIGFVFQNFQLIPTLTAIENVLVPLELHGEINQHHAAAKLLKQVGLGDRLEHYPMQLSGGEQQRVALARAFIHRPKLLFADEPTGNLDAETSAPIIEMLFQLNEEAGTSLVLVTHDPSLAIRAKHQVTMRAGTIIAQKDR